MEPGIDCGPLPLTITGHFISVDVPEVAVGEDIKATIDFYALNPGALYWATYLTVNSGFVLGGPVLLDKAREIGEEGGRKKTYNLGKMPDTTFTLFFHIFAHDDATHDWDWWEYDAFLEGYPTPLTYIDSRYKTISPGVAPPPELEFDLTRPTPSETPVLPGTAITLTCPITSRCSESVNASAKVIIYEGSIWPGHGDKIAEYDRTFYIEPNKTRNIVVSHTTIAGTIDRRDVQVEVYVDSELIKESEWDDIYYVTEAPPEYEGKIVSKELEVMGLATLPIPLIQLLDLNSKVKVHVTTRNIGLEKYHPNCQWEVKDPVGDLVSSYNHTAFDMASPGEESHFFEAIETFTLRDEGVYTIEIWLSVSESGELLDYWAGNLCTIAEEAPPPECTTDADCPPGYVCVNGVCVPEVEVKKEFHWAPVLIGAGAVIATVGIVATAKKE